MSADQQIECALYWRPIDTAPKDGTKILAYCPKHPDGYRVIRVTWWRRPEDGHGFIGWGEFNMQYWPPTHWMPLPKPPGEERVSGFQMNVLDLFSGIGGFSLGLERAGMRTVAFCDSDPFCRRVLAKHWPDIPCYDDVHAVPPLPYQVLCGGPPCQRTSLAAAVSGKRTGETLWPAMFAIVQRDRPEWIIVEQPPGNARWEATVAGDLARAGYHAERLKRSARDCGAPHIRWRVLFVANAVRERCETVARLAQSSASQAVAWPAPPRGAWRTPGAGDRGMDDGLSAWVDRLRTLGNTVMPQVAETIGRAIVATDYGPSPGCNNT